ncbi:MAG: serine/threonine protein kinase [Deltaproteobacteria bacterium]|nr:serine/threonine protein kinase [Deltaproteobacteria bacterium]
MGQIYMARHVTLKKRYAVKMLHSEFCKNQEAVERFRREATTAGELEHPNIINVTDIDYTDDNRAYIVMEFLEGRELRDDLNATPVLATDRMVHIFSQVYRALEAAHSRGIVHRDLKPENIFMVDLPDQPDTVKILDFGISKIKTAGATNLTQTGMVIGTPHYMAPEQARGDRDVDHRADIYALGAILYEACTGQVPATGETATAILMKILLEEPIPPRQINPNLSPELEAVIMRAMCKDPNMRFQSCNEMGEALKAATGYSTVAGGMHAPTGMPVQAPIPTGYPSQQQVQPAYPTAQQTVEQGPPPGYGTAQTPMTWTGGAATGTGAMEPPPKKRGSAALIVIPVVLVLILILGGGAVAALYFSGMIGGTPRGVNVPDELAAKELAAKKLAAKGAVDEKPDDGAKASKEAKESASTAPEGKNDGKVKIKFTTTPTGADVILKIGTHQRTICSTICMHEFNETDKLVTVILRKSGYRDQTLEFTPDFNKELITKLSRKGKKKGGGTVIKELPTKPSWEIKPKPGGKKKPIIKVIDKPKKPDKPKKKPAIKIISSPKK